MTQLTYPLSVLVRAVAFRNLSSASLHVGLSQPQLSRIIAQVEAELGLELLNRQVRRKSSWTPQALKLAEVFEQHQRRLDHAVRDLQGKSTPRAVHIGTLEGLSDLAVTFAKRLFDGLKIPQVSLDVFDLTELEAKFLSGDLDLILNTRVPNRSKPRFMKVCGYQTLDLVEQGEDFGIYSSFEFNLKGAAKKNKAAKTLISNSLYIRRTWIEKFGGKGNLPSTVMDKTKRGADEVLLLGGDWLDPRVWNAL
jgi:hypothetical protein